MSNKTVIVLGVTGSIAAYKAADLTSKLTQNGYDVTVIMTEAAQKLVTPQTFLTLSRNPVITSLWDVPEWKPMHIALADRASVLLIAPATANILAKMAHGIADDALSTYYLSHTGRVLVVPAMNERMWNHWTVQENCAILARHGVEIIEPSSGNLACGTAGKGRMADVEEIMKRLHDAQAVIS